MAPNPWTPTPASPNRPPKTGNPPIQSQAPNTPPNTAVPPTSRPCKPRPQRACPPPGINRPRASTERGSVLIWPSAPIDPNIEVPQAGRCGQVQGVGLLALRTTPQLRPAGCFLTGLLRADGRRAGQLRDGEPHSRCWGLRSGVHR